MNRCFRAAALVVVALAFTATAADPVKPTVPTTAAALKGKLLPHFRSLGLTADQKARVEIITGAAAAKIHDLQLEIAAARDKEKADAMAVLTDGPRQQLKSILTAGVEDKKP